MTATLLKQHAKYEFEAHKVVDVAAVSTTTKHAFSADDETFTFKPKVSAQSKRIVENMGTDFMERQQQHLEKQKKLVS